MSSNTERHAVQSLQITDQENKDDAPPEPTHWDEIIKQQINNDDVYEWTDISFRGGIDTTTKLGAIKYIQKCAEDEQEFDHYQIMAFRTKTKKKKRHNKNKYTQR
eukprot:387844_1